VSGELLQPQTGGLGMPPPTPLTAPFWSGCEAGELRFQRCPECGRAEFPPSEHCRNCLSEAITWEVSSGRGEVYSFTVVYRPVTPNLHVPYAPVIVDFAEGFQMLTNLVGVPVDGVQVGVPVRVRFVAVDGRTLPYVEPAG
jgi:uncharacterized protein